MRDKLFRDGWAGVEPHLIRALGEMGGCVARDILVEYVRDDRARHASSAFVALRGIDPRLAAESAEQFLATARGTELRPSQRRRIKDAVR